jgi:hypothetical protein
MQPSKEDDLVFMTNINRSADELGSQHDLKEEDEVVNSSPRKNY